jgi:dihydroorotate dehydrogenase electron transfer subunit
MVRGWEGFDPLLPRPFSFHRLHPARGSFHLLVRIAGKATSLMAAWSPGHSVSLLGPLGTGFTLPRKGASAAIVTRGAGVAPMVALAERLKARGVGVKAFMSARSRTSMVCYETMCRLAQSVEVTSDDGSMGPPGLVTDFLERHIGTQCVDVVYVCGSRRLARAVSRLQKVHGFSAFVSLEEHMACGVGACKGCVVGVAEAGSGLTYRRVCREGPLFPLEILCLE